MARTSFLPGDSWHDVRFPGRFPTRCPIPGSSTSGVWGRGNGRVLGRDPKVPRRSAQCLAIGRWGFAASGVSGSSKPIRSAFSLDIPGRPAKDRQRTGSPGAVARPGLPQTRTCRQLTHSVPQVILLLHDGIPSEPLRQTAGDSARRRRANQSNVPRHARRRRSSHFRQSRKTFIVKTGDRETVARDPVVRIVAPQLLA